MNQKILVYCLIALALLLFGCTGSFPSKASSTGPEPLAKEPSFEVEATVISLEPSTDSAVLRIDKIQSEAANSEKPFNEGDMVNAKFTYSIKPAKLRYDIPPTCRENQTLKQGSCFPEGNTGPETMVSSPSYEKISPTEENGFIVYRLPEEKNKSETILPGIEENSKIRATIYEHDLIRTLGQHIIIRIYEKI